MLWDKTPIKFTKYFQIVNMVSDMSELTGDSTVIQMQQNIYAITDQKQMQDSCGRNIELYLCITVIYIVKKKKKKGLVLEHRTAIYST